MSFWNSFTHGFAHGAFNSMFGGWGMNCCGWTMPCCNQTPLFFTPSLFMGGFNRYAQPMVNVPQLPIVLTPITVQWPDVSMSGFDFIKTEIPKFEDNTGFDTFSKSSSSKISLGWDSQMSSSYGNNSLSGLPDWNSGSTFASSSVKNTKSAKSTVAKGTDSKSNVKVRHWSKMSDDELKAVYGGYTRDITTPYSGTAEDINKYLRGKGALEGQGQAFIDAQNKYGISASVLVGIAMFETGGGKSSLAKNKNNVGGVRIKGSTEFKKFDSVADCVMEMARFLKAGYVENSGRPLTALYQVNAKYCPASETSNNSRWAKNVDAYASALENTSVA